MNDPLGRCSLDISRLKILRLLQADCIYAAMFNASESFRRLVSRQDNQFLGLEPANLKIRFLMPVATPRMEPRWS